MGISVKHMLCGLLAAAAIMPVPVMGEGHWLERNHDFGAFDENLGVVYCEFKLVNTGTEPMSVVSVRANCGCTRPEFSKDPVAPGDTAVVRVGFDPKGRPGRFSKRINVDCSSEPSRTALTISGTVIGSSNTLRTRYPVAVGPVRLRSTTIPYGKVFRGETAGQYIDAYNASSDTLRPYATGAPRYLNVMMQPDVVAPGEQFIISTVMHSGKADEWGTLTGSFMFYPDHDASTGQEIETVVMLEEDFSRLTPAERAAAPVLDTDVTAIDLRHLDRSGSPVKRTFTISNKGKSPLVIRRISCSDPAVTLRLKDTKIKPGKSSRVDVTVTPSLVANAELLNARINIIANDPDHPSTMVRVVAEIK